jgi:GDSL-like Lipase/Acylhydrolase family
VPSAVQAETFDQMPGAYVWFPDSANDAWRLGVPSSGPAIDEIVEVEAGSHASYFLTTAGEIFGRQGYGLTDSFAHSLVDIVGLEASFHELFALTGAGEVWSLGFPFGVNGTAAAQALSPVRIPIPPVSQLEIDGPRFAAVTLAGELYVRDFVGGSGTYELIQTGVKAVARSDSAETAIIKLDGTVFELDGFGRPVPVAPFVARPVQGLPLTIQSVSYAQGLFLAVSSSGDVYVWPRAALQPVVTAPQATQLPGVAGVVEAQIGQASTTTTLANGNRATNLYLTIRTEGRRLSTGKLVGVTGGADTASELILPSNLDLVEHNGSWDGFDARPFSQIIAFSRTSATPDEEPCWQNVETTDPSVQVCGVQIIRDGWDLNRLALGLTRTSAGDIAVGVAGSIRFMVNGESSVVGPRRLQVVVNTVRTDAPLIGVLTSRLITDARVVTIAGARISKANSERGGSLVVRVTLDLDLDGVADAGEPSIDRTGQWRRPIAFGDSYSSGEGASDYDRDSTSSANSCHRSEHAYARKLKIKSPGTSALDGVSSQVRLYACSGARTYTMTSTVKISDNLRTAEKSGILTMNGIADLPASEAEALGPNENTTNEKRQVLRFRDEIAVLGTAVSRPDYITVGIGGNDMEFGNYLTKYCLTVPITGLGPCGANDPWTPDDALDATLFPGVNTFGSFIDRKLALTIERMSRSIDEVMAASADTPVVLMGYPMLFSSEVDTDFSSSTACMVAGFLWGGSASYFRTKQVEVNVAMRALASRKGVHFVDLLPAYDSARAGMCGKGGAGINNFALTQSDFGKNCVRVGEVVGVVGLGLVKVVGGAIITGCLAKELAKNDWEAQAFLTQSHAHPNIKGQKLNTAAITKYFSQAQGARTPAGIPVNPAVAVAASEQLQPIAVNQLDARFPSVSAAFSARNGQLAIGSFAPTVVAQATTNWVGTISVDAPRCRRSVGVAFPIRFGGLGSAAQQLSLVEVDSNSTILTLSALPESTVPVTVPAAWADRALQFRGGAGVTPSQVFEVTPSPAPCALPNYERGPAGQSTLLNLLGNDGSGAATISDFRSNVSWISAGDGGLVTATPPLRAQGTYSFSYSSCTVNGACTSSGGTFDVLPPACTFTASPATPTLVGTDGDDVMCADETTVEVRGGDGNDLIYIRGPATFINSGVGVDRIVADGVIVLVSPDEDQIESSEPVLRLSTGSATGFPTTGTPVPIDTAPPVVRVTLPETINVGEQASALVTCTDPSGLADCPSTVGLNTSAVGVFSGSVTATDSAGNETLESFWYTVSDPFVATTTTTSTTTTTTTIPVTSTTVVPVSQFRARNGVVSSGEIAERIFVERTGAAGDYDPDGDGWALVGRSNGDGDNGLVARFWIENGVPMVSTRHPQKGCLQSTPLSLDPVKKGQTRLLGEVARDTAQCRSTPPEADVDGDGLADNVQPLYRARTGNVGLGELASRVYVERNRHAAEAQLGVSDFDPDRDGWALVGRTNGETWATVSPVFVEPLVLRKGTGCRQFSFDASTVRRGQTRILTIGVVVPCPS